MSDDSMPAGPTPATADRRLHRSDFPDGIPVSLWGKDHHSTLLYAETRAVESGGLLGEKHMREDGHTYPTRLADGSTVYAHDDYDCLNDAVQAGFLTYDRMPRWIGDENGPKLVRFTEAGWAYVHALRRARAERHIRPGV